MIYLRVSFASRVSSSFKMFFSFRLSSASPSRVFRRWRCHAFYASRSTLSRQIAESSFSLKWETYSAQLYSAMVRPRLPAASAVTAKVHVVGSNCGGIRSVPSVQFATVKQVNKNFF